MDTHIFGIGSNILYPSMDQCYADIDIDQTDLDVSASSSSLPFEFVDSNKSQLSPSPPHVAMFYPQLGYDFHPLLMNQRKRNDPMLEKFDDPLPPDNLQLSPHNIINSPKIKTRKSTRYAKKRNDLINSESDSLVQHSLNDNNNDTNRKIFFCRDCGKSFKFQTSLLRHNNKVHNLKYQCPNCRRVFSRQAYLDVHTSKPGSSCFVTRFTNVRPKV